MAFKSTNTVNVEISTTADNSGVDKAKDGIKGFGQTASGASEAAESMSKQYSAGMNKIAIATAAVGVGLTAYAKTATDYVVGLVGNTKTLARVTGESQEETSRLIAATSKLGISSEEAASTFGILSKAIQKQRDDSKDAGQKQEELANKMAAARIEITKLTDDTKKNGDSTGENANKVQALNIQLQKYAQEATNAKGPLEKLNVATQNADGSSRGFNDILMDVADRFKAMPDGVEKTTTSMELFGRSGKDLLAFLNQGSTGIKEMEDAAEKLGLTLTKENIESMAKYTKSQKELKASSDSLKISVGLLTAPVMTEFNKKIMQVQTSLIGTQSPFRGAIANVLAFGGPVAGAASGMAGFAGNIASAGPLLSKLPALLNPTTLAIVGTVAAIGALSFGAYKLWQHFEKNKEQLPEMVKGTHEYGASVTFLKLAQDAQEDSQKAVNDAVTAHQVALDSIKPAQDIAKQKADAVTQAQQAMKTALDQYGTSSPQYIEAAKTLTDRETELNLQLLNNWSNAVNVKTAEDNLATARSNLATSTADLNRLQDILNKGLDSAVQVIAKFGPTADAQVNSIATLQVKLDGVVATYNGFSIKLQNQLPQQGSLLQGLGSTIGKIQGQSDKLNGSLQGAKSNLQVSSGAGLLQGARASGGPVSAGGRYLVGEEGPEIVEMGGNGTVHSNGDSKKMLGSTTTVSIGNVYLTTAEATREWIDHLDQDTILSGRGMTPNRGGI